MLKAESFLLLRFSIDATVFARVLNGLFNIFGRQL